MPQLAPSPKFRAVGADGLALVGGKLYAYVEGTSTPKDTYTDFGIGTANANPVILDSRGEASVWLDGAYKLVLKDADDVTIWTVDSIRDLTQNQTLTGATLAGTLTISSTAVTWSGNPTHSGNHTFSGNVTVNGNTQIGNASTDTLTVDPNAVTWTNNPTHSGNHTFSGNVAVTGTLTVTGDVTLAVPSGTFTPAITFGGAAVGVTYNVNTAGAYRKIDDVVYFWLRLRLSSKGSSTGNASITGLPFAYSNSLTVTQAVFSIDAAGMTGLTGALIARGASGSSAVAVAQWGAAATAVLTDAAFTNTSDVFVSGHYVTD